MRFCKTTLTCLFVKLWSTNRSCWISFLILQCLQIVRKSTINQSVQSTEDGLILFEFKISSIGHSHSSGKSTSLSTLMTTETKMWLLLQDSAFRTCSSHALSHRHQFSLRPVEPNLVYMYFLGVTRVGEGNNNIKCLNLCIT